MAHHETYSFLKQADFRERSLEMRNIFLCLLFLLGTTVAVVTAESPTPAGPPDNQPGAEWNGTLVYKDPTSQGQPQMIGIKTRLVKRTIKTPSAQEFAEYMAKNQAYWDHLSTTFGPAAAEAEKRKMFGSTDPNKMIPPPQTTMELEMLEPIMVTK